MEGDKNAKRVSKAELYDTGAIRRLLDGEVAEALEDAGYAEGTNLIDFKILLSCVSVGSGLYAHFGCKNFPQDRNVIALCVTAWMVCFATIFVIDVWVTGGAFFVATPKAVKRAGPKRPSQLLSRILASSTLPKYGTQYSLTLKGPQQFGSVATVNVEYPSIFTADGLLLVKEFRNVIQDGLKQVSNAAKKN